MKHSIVSEPTGTSIAELMDRGSRFIAEAAPVHGAAEARERVAGVRREYPGASHVVHAFVVGPSGSTTEGFSDDGEPHGTAGKPVLDVVRGRRLTNVVVTVVRYFGGTKLGTGGLVRAYGAAAARALDTLPCRELVARGRYRLAVGYELYETVRRIIESHSGSVTGAEFATAVHLAGELPLSQWEVCRSALADASNGTAHLDRAESDLE